MARQVLARVCRPQCCQTTVNRCTIGHHRVDKGECERSRRPCRAQVDLASCRLGASLRDRPGGRLTVAGRTSAGRRSAVTLRDVAARAAVSTATASRALAGDTAISAPTRERVTEAARALDYRPHAAARSLRRRSTQLLGVLVTTSGDAYAGEVVHGIDCGREERGTRSSSPCPTSTAPGSGRRSRSSCTNGWTASSPSPHRRRRHDEPADAARRAARDHQLGHGRAPAS